MEAASFFIVLKRKKRYSVQQETAPKNVSSHCNWHYKIRISYLGQPLCNFETLRHSNLKIVFLPHGNEQTEKNRQCTSKRFS